MTALQSVMVSSTFGHVHRSEGARKRAAEALEMVGLAEKSNTITAELTLSDRRLLEVAMALASMPVVALSWTSPWPASIPRRPRKSSI